MNGLTHASGQRNILMGKVTSITTSHHVFFKNQFQVGRRSKREWPTTNLPENTPEYLHDLQGGFNEMTDKLDDVKIRNICSSKSLTKTVERQPQSEVTQSQGKRQRE